MKKTLILACSIALVAAAAFAQTASQHPVTLAEIMAPAESPVPLAAAPAPAAAAQDQPLFLASRHGAPAGKVLCQASCGSYNVSCTSTSAGTCIAVDRNCPITAGYVSCDGATTNCTPSCTSQICTPGATRYLWDGSSCCGEGGKEKDEEVCSADGTYWYFTGNYICAGLCGRPIQ